MPHRDHPGLLQSITYRLSDSLPSEALKRLQRSVEGAPAGRRGSELRKRVEEWLDAGHGSCVLHQPEAAWLVVEGWKQYACQRYDLIAWVVMPNHVHLLIRAYAGVPLGKIVQGWKSYSAREIRKLIGSPSGRSALPGGSANNLNGAPKPESVWQRDYWDRYIRDEKHFAAAIEYIHQNPVKAGLARRAEDWAWSSAREYAGETFAELGFGLPVEAGSAALEAERVGEDAEQALGAPRLGAPRTPRPGS